MLRGPTWPWPLRKVRKANISSEERDLFERCGETVISMQVTGSFTANVEHAKSWLTERADYHERREQWISGRDFFLEIVIIVLIGWEIHEGREQAKSLQHMDTSTAATANAMQTARDSLKSLADTQNETLRILQAEQAERAKKPRLALYAGNTLLDKTAIHLKLRGGVAQTMASLDLLLKNEGDAPVSTFRLHALVPGDVILNSNPLLTVPEYEPSANPSSHTVTLQLPPLPAGQKVRIHVEIIVPNGRSLFKIPFTVDALELQAVAPLGSLTVLPPKL